jgi:16S rRNA (guanine966-N2)-methyltransferase
MRFIAGSRRGMKLFSPKTYDSRPITDRVKESLFDVLSKYNLPHNTVVADLFAGVGSLGLEALSRGARFVTFVEQDPEIITVLERNIEKTDFVKESKVVKANAFRIGAPVDEQKYDLIFVDPPYAETQNTSEDSPLADLLKLLEQRTSADAIVVVRAHRKVSLLGEYAQFKVVDRRQWGTMAITILRKN